MPFDRGTDTCIWCLHPVEDDSALTREERVTHCNISELPKHYTKENKTHEDKYSAVTLTGGAEDRRTHRDEVEEK